MTRAVAAGLIAAALGGCLSPIAPDVGPLVHASCSNDDSDPATPVRFGADLHDAIFAGDEYHCTRCHTARGATPIGLEVGGLDLHSYDALRAGGRHGETVVVPGRPCDSLLVQKLGEAPPFGARMPLDGPPFLDDEDLQRVSDWIAEGAHEN